MIKFKRFSLPFAAFALLLGLFLPFLTAAIQDASVSRELWTLSDSNAHYAYQGTLMNRAIALNAHLTGSPAVLRSQIEPEAAPAGLIDALSAFLPVEGVMEKNSSAFSLSPAQYTAEYRYLEISCALNGLSLTVIADTETGLPLRMELHCPPDELEAWLEAHDLWEILRGYTALLDLGEPTDDETTISEVLISQSAQIRGTAYKATVTVIPSAGSLLLKLAASTPA